MQIMQHLLSISSPLLHLNLLHLHKPPKKIYSKKAPQIPHLNRQNPRPNIFSTKIPTSSATILKEPTTPLPTQRRRAPAATTTTIRLLTLQRTDEAQVGAPASSSVEWAPAAQRFRDPGSGAAEADEAG